MKYKYNTLVGIVEKPLIFLKFWNIKDGIYTLGFQRL